jgi:hypothetical protein
MDTLDLYQYNTPKQEQSEQVIKLDEVFTPSFSHNEKNFVERRDVKGRFESALKMPGRIIVIHGEPGSGKSSFIHKQLRTFVQIDCNSDNTVETLLIQAFNELGILTKTEQTEEHEQGWEIGITQTLKVLGEFFGTIFGKKKVNRKFEPLGKPDIKIGKLIDSLKGKHCLIVNFHKLEARERKRFAEALEAFKDHPNPNSVKLIVVGDEKTANEIRGESHTISVTEIKINLMTEEEIRTIVTYGTDLLKIEFDKVMIQKITQYSSGLAKVCHQLCYSICELKGIDKQKAIAEKIDPIFLVKARNIWLDDNDLGKIKINFDNAIKKPKSSKFSIRQLILEVLADTDKNGITTEEIRAQIKSREPQFRTGIETLTVNLNQLRKKRIGEFVKFNGQVYSFSKPLYRAYAKMYFDRSIDN